MVAKSRGPYTVAYTDSDGEVYEATYRVLDEQMVRLTSAKYGSHTTQIGGLTEEEVAELLLMELAQKEKLSVQ